MKSSDLNSVKREIKEDKMGFLDVYTKKLPRWLLPTCTNPSIFGSKPDIVWIENMTITDAERIARHKGPFYAPDIEKFHIHIIEVGYSSDTRWKAKYEKKQHQHDEIEQALINEGWQVSVHPVIFGTAATIFKHSLDILLLLGVPRPAALTCLKKINIYAAQSAHAHLVRTLSTKPIEIQHDPP